MPSETGQLANAFVVPPPPGVGPPLDPPWESNAIPLPCPSKINRVKMIMRTITIIITAGIHTSLVAAAAVTVLPTVAAVLASLTAFLKLFAVFMAEFALSTTPRFLSLCSSIN